MLPVDPSPDSGRSGISGAEEINSSGKSAGAGAVLCVKPMARAAAKARLCYGGDVSLLLDCCRRTVAVESLVGLADCLEAVAADSELDIVAVRDGITCAANSPATGFRSQWPHAILLPGAKKSVGPKITYSVSKLLFSIHLCRIHA
jgi:hypothetical protein